MRRALALHRPTLLAGVLCAGLGLANWLSPGALLLAVCGVTGVVGVAALDGEARTAALALTLLALGLGWGSLRLEALGESALRREVGTSGTAELVVTAPARRTPWAVRVQVEVRSYRARPLRERALLLLPVGRAPPRGAVLEASVRVDEPRPPDGGGFDERAWLARQGIHVVLRGSDWRQVGRRGGIAGFGDRLRDRIERAVSRGTTGVRRALVLGVVLGEDEGLPETVRRDFRASGLAHLLAVSGQNVAFIAGGVYGLCWLLRLARAGRELVAVGAIASYVLAVGWQPSLVRAAVAGALASLAWLAARPSDRWHFLVLGALLLLAWMPTSLLDAGFQLSFVAVAAIFVGLPRARLRLEGYPVPSFVVDPLAVAVVCGLATAPLMLFHFDRAPVYTVPANLLAFPALPAVLAFGLLSALVDPFATGAATSLAWLAGWGAAWLELVARVVASVPGAQADARVAIAIAVLAAGGGLVLRHSPAQVAVGGRAAVAAAGCAAIAVVGWWSVRPAPAWDEPAGFRATFLDVGQGDSVLIETASARILVDEGPPEADVAGQLARMGVQSLSAIVLTHPERDHVGGAAAVVRRLRVGVVLDPDLEAVGPYREEAVAAARARGVPVRVVRAGSEFRAGGIALHVLWPADAGLRSENPNLNAVVLVASYGETDVLLPADAESEVTARLPLSPVEVLKVAHHGSEDPGLAEELHVLHPQVAVISCGRDNEYGHPRPETLAALAASPGLTVYRTDEDGRVVIESDGRRLRARTAK